jgi:hypothetical protein
MPEIYTLEFYTLNVRISFKKTRRLNFTANCNATKNQPDLSSEANRKPLFCRLKFWRQR